MSLYSFLIAMFTAGIYSFGYCDAEILPLSSSEAEDDFYGKLSTLSSQFAPTAFLPLEEFDTFSDNSSLRKINRQCIEDSRHYVKALWNQSEWALSMYHASGRLSTDESTNFLIVGLDTNVHQDPGLFDQCIATSSPSGKIRGQYCSVFLSARPLLMQHDDNSLLIEPKISSAERQQLFRTLVPVNATNSIIGFCLPSSCSAKDLQTAVAHKIGRTTIQTKNRDGTVTVQSVVTINHDRFCHSQNKIQDQHALDATDIAFLVVICFIGLLILISTLHECWTRTLLRHRKNIQKEMDDYLNVLRIRILHCFSALKNVKSFINTAPFSDDIQCLHGIRGLSFVFIIMFHTGSEIFIRDRLYNNDTIIQLLSSWYGQPASNLSVVVDTFFLIGGLLVATSLLKDLDRGRFNLRRFYFNRYLRLTPLYAGVLFFLASFGSHVGSGPYWTTPLSISEDCRSYWWSHVLYINNMNFTLCMPHTWYLSTEMQLFIFSPIVVYPLWRWQKRKGSLLAAFLLAFSFSYTTAIYLVWDLPPTMVINRPSFLQKASKYFYLYYLNPFARCPPYLIGILLGWILHKTENSENKLSKLSLKPTLMVGWILCVVIPVVVLYGPLLHWDEETAPVIYPFFSVIYGVFHRTVWSIAITWIIYLCAKGYGESGMLLTMILMLGIVNDLLSSKICVFLAKISYSGYLVHFNVIVHYVSQLRIPFYYTLNQFSVINVGIIVITLVISTFLTITIEMPFRNLGKCIFPETLLSSRKSQTGVIINGKKSAKERGRLGVSGAL